MLYLPIVIFLIFALVACSAPTPVPPTSAPQATKVATAAPQATKAVVAEPTKPPAPTSVPAKPVKYNEAPQLAEQVKAGKLPPVEKRLPEEPLVVKPTNEIGKYGGEYRGAAFGPTHGQLDTEALRMQSLLFIEPDLKSLSPNIVKEVQVSPDFKTYTLILRKGMKWSDGQPFTADDFLFWYEDELGNDELYPSKPVAYQSGGKLMKMTKVDDITVKVEFETPNMNFDLILSKSYWNDRMFAPKHYLKQFHIKYNDKANDLAKAERFESWVQLYQFHADYGQAQQDTNLPDITPWVLTKIDDVGNKYFDRNPYYWKVDTAGNQLPYIDRQVSVLVKDAQVRTLKLIGRELDAAGENPLPVKDFTLYKENEAKGNYKVFLFNNTRGNDVGFSFNLTIADPVLKQIFRDLRFREAMSLAINRKQINDVLYFGNGQIRQATIPDVVSFYEDWMGNYMIEYDPAKANALLDEMGLKWDASKQVRLRPDGKPLQIVLECWEEFCPHSEMVAEMWTAVGVKTIMKQNERSLWNERATANQIEVAAYPYDAIAEANLRSESGAKLRPSHGAAHWSVLWRDWYNTKGQKGEEPPKEVQEYYDKWIKFSQLKPGSPEYMQLGKELTTYYTKQLWALGISVAPRVIIISNRLGNTPTEGTFAGDFMFWVPYRGDQWYVK